jgi:hypothetical protein
VNPASLYSAGVLLTRVARACGDEPALLTDAGAISHRELAGCAIHLAGDLAAIGSSPFLVGSSRDATAVLASYAAYLSESPLLAGDGPGPVEKAAAAVLDRALAERGREAREPAGPSPDPRPFDQVAQSVRLDAGCDLDWTHEALCFGWGVATPPPGTVGIISSPAWDPMAWASVYGVLLGRGRVVVPPRAGAAAWLDAVAAGGVTEVHLYEEDLDAVLGLSRVGAPSVLSVRVWARGAVDLVRLAALRDVFPAASVGRVLAGPGGPLSVALLPALQDQGARALGRAVLGLRLAMTPASELLVAESAFAPRQQATGLPWGGTGIAVSRNSAGTLCLRDEPGSRVDMPRGRQPVAGAGCNASIQGGVPND